MSEQEDTQPSLPTQDIEVGAGASRRAFLRRLAVGGGLALGVGGLAAYVVNRQRATVVVLPNGDAVRVPAGAGVGGATDLLAQLADLKEALSESDEQRRVLAEQLAGAQAQIEQLNREREELLSLVALYEALEEIDLDNAVASGFAAVGASMAGALGLVGLLEKGVSKGLGALGELVEGFPGPQAGIIWLKGEVSALLLNLENLRQRIEEAIQPIESFATLVAEFILDVLRRLPFGLGDPASAGLQTMKTIVAGLPLLADGIATDVLDPLAVWFGQDGRTNLLGTLVTPLEDDLIVPASDTADTLSALGESYQNELVTPVEAALEARAYIRAQIEAQRARLGETLLARSRRGVG